MSQSIIDNICIAAMTIGFMVFMYKMEKLK